MLELMFNIISTICVFHSKNGCFARIAMFCRAPKGLSPMHMLPKRACTGAAKAFMGLGEM